MRPAAVILATVLALAALPATADTLTLLTWDRYLSPRVEAAWEAESGTALEIVTFSSRGERDAILAVDRGDVDLAVVNESVLKPLVDAWRVVEVSERTVPSVRNSDPRFRRMCRDSGLPYSRGTLGIAYRADRMERPRSWADLLRPAEGLRRRIAMMRAEDELLAPPLILLGRPVDSGSDADVDAAISILREQAPSVRGYDYALSDLGRPESLTEVDMALAYSGDHVALAQADGGTWRYSLPEEGALVWVDCMTVMSSSSRRELALRLLDFLGRPEIAAANASDLSLATTNSAALPLLPPGTRDDPQVFPPAEVLDRSGPYPRLPVRASIHRKRAVASFFSE